MHNFLNLNATNPLDRIYARLALLNLAPPEQYANSYQQTQQQLIQRYCDDEGKLVFFDRDDYLTASINSALKESLPFKQYLLALLKLDDTISKEIYKAESSGNIFVWVWKSFWAKIHYLLSKQPKSSCTVKQAQNNHYNKDLLQFIYLCLNGKNEDAHTLFNTYADDSQFQLIYSSFTSTQKKNQQKKEKELSHEQKETIEAITTEQLLEVALEENYEFTTDCQRHEQRTKAINESLAKQEFFSKQYHLLPQSQKLLSQTNIDPSQFTSCYGNALQQALHQEHLAIIDISTDLYFKFQQSPETKDIIEHTLHFVDAASACNHAGYLQKSIRVTDCCWGFLDSALRIAKGVTKGVYKGTINYVGYALDHPIESITRPIIGNFLFAYHIAQLTLDIADIARIGVGNFVGHENSIQEWQQLCANITAIKNALQEKYHSLNLQDCVTEITAVTTQALLDYKCSRALFKFYQSGERKTLELIETLKTNLPPPPLPAVALTPDGFEVGIACQAAAIATGSKDSILAKLEEFGGSNNLFASSIRTFQDKNCTQQTDQKIPDFIKFDKVPQDKETILADPSFIRTKKIYDGARIYKKNNLYYYRDQLHTGKRAHLEVFNKRGKHLGEADPITGTLIPGTLDKNKTIKI